jgi:teichuronic acid biosynthesis glycosyltransferase TuaG
VPRVSVVIPAYNSAHFIEQALASVHAQTYEDWEVLAVDDASTDATWRLLQAAGPRVRSFRRESPGGPALTRNLALAHASGELAVFVDPDDLLLPSCLERQVAYYDAALEHVGGPLGLVACDARIAIEDEYMPYTHLGRIPDRGVPLVLDRVLRRNPIFIGGSLVPVVAGEAVGWFDPELFGSEDFALWLKLFEAGYRAALNDEVLTVYRRHAGAASSNLAFRATYNRRAYEMALARGRLTAKQRRVARRAIRYNQAMEQVALLRFARGRTRALALGGLRRLPLLIWVALGNVRMWPEWLELLRTGRAKDAVELRVVR